MKRFLIALVSVLSFLTLATQVQAAQDALDEVNATRAARGLPPFIRDDLLTRAAKGCADYRAERQMAGHTSNDFAALPPGAIASSAGCAAWPQSMGWGACCTYDGYTHAGAAYQIGSDGQRYMHIFVRGENGQGGSSIESSRNTFHRSAPVRRGRR